MFNNEYKLESHLFILEMTLSFPSLRWWPKLVELTGITTWKCKLSHFCVSKIIHAARNFKVLLTNGGLGGVSLEFAFCSNVIVRKMVLSARSNWEPANFDRCTCERLDNTMEEICLQGSWYICKSSILIYFLLCLVEQKITHKKAFWKKLIFCNFYCNILLKYYLSKNSNVLYSAL